MRNADNSGGHESHDNTNAMLWVSWRLGMDYHKDFLSYGESELAKEYDAAEKSFWVRLGYIGLSSVQLTFLCS